MSEVSPLRVGIGGPVGSGKTALTLALCRALRDTYQLGVVTNDIYTEEDAQFLVRNEALAPERIIGVETGGCPHTAIREDASINLDAVDGLSRKFPELDLVIIESGGDNLAATFSPELAGRTDVEVALGRAMARMREHLSGEDDQDCGCAVHSIPSVSTNFTIVSRPCPVLRLLNTKGRAPRIFFASRAITSSEAPTIGARSILLITRRSDLVMPGPPFLGILSPAATSMT